LRKLTGGHNAGWLSPGNLLRMTWTTKDHHRTLAGDLLNNLTGSHQGFILDPLNGTDQESRLRNLRRHAAHRLTKASCGNTNDDNIRVIKGFESVGRHHD